MQTITKIINRTIEISLLLILLILPFSYSKISVTQSLGFIILILFISIVWKFKANILRKEFWGVFLAIGFMYVFGFAEQVNFIQQFNIPIEVNKRIPLSTVLLAVGILLFLLKILIEERMQITTQPFARFFLFACFFLVAIMVLFYPFLFYYYNMKLDLNIQLLNKILKYLIIILLITSYISDESKLKRMNLYFIFSSILTVILNILLA